MKGFKTEVVVTGGEKYEGKVSTSYKTYNLMEVQRIIMKHRRIARKNGMPTKKLIPVTLYILEELIDEYTQDGASVLDIKIEEVYPHGI